MPNSYDHGREAQGSDGNSISVSSVPEGSAPASNIQPLTALFSGGETLELAGNRPLYASDSGSFWLVSKGQADLFAVRMRDGRVSGARIHLFQVREGELVFGALLKEEGTDLALMAVGKPGTQMVRLGRDRLREALLSETHFHAALSAVETWIIRMSRIIDPNRPPSGNFVQVVTGMTMKNVIDGGELDAAIDKFHGILLRALAAGAEQKAARDRTHFDQRLDGDGRGIENAFYRLGEMLFRSSRTAQPSIRSSTPLVAAAMAVAEACGIRTAAFSRILPREKENLQLDDVARAGGFFTRQVVLTPEWSRRDNGPLLGRMEEDGKARFVAILPLSPRRYELFDPEKGLRIPVTPGVEERIAPIAWSFYRPLPPKALTLGDIVVFALEGAWKDLGTIAAVGVAGALLALLIPVMTGIIVDSVIPEANRRELLQIGLILMVSVFATFMFQITRAIATVRMEGRMDAGLQSAVMDRILGLPAPFFRKFTAGDLSNRALGINQIRQILSGATLTTALTAVFSSFNLIVMLFYDWKLSLVGLAIILVILLISGSLSLWMVRYQRRIFHLHGRISGIVLQLLTGIAKLRVTGTEDRAFGVWAESFSKKKAIDFKSGKINAALDTATTFLPMVSAMLIFWFFLEFRKGTLSTGHFLAFNSAFVSFQAALVQVTLTFTGLLHIIPLWERSKPILSAVPEVDDAKTPVSYLSGRLNVDHVSFRYSDDGPLVLKDVSMDVSPGEFVALVGGSGSGKSTLLRNLLGFEKPGAGAVFYDGRDLRDLDIKSVRRQMGVVLQKGQVMPGSLLKNITGAINLTLDDAWEAARMVGLDEDIEAMPMGMHTVVPAGGSTLSGGQRQRILIARAIVRRPRILFFDEATSALDNRTQAIVSESIERLNVTRVVIAHRLSTIMKADRIYVMEKGRIVESGGYEELMNSKGAFYQLAIRQIA